MPTDGWKIKIKRVALSYLKRLPSNERFFIKVGLDELKKSLSGVETKPLDIRPLKGRLKGLYRLRIGGLRLIIDFDGDNRIVIVHAIETRGDVYK